MLTLRRNSISFSPGCGAGGAPWSGEELMQPQSKAFQECLKIPGITPLIPSEDGVLISKFFEKYGKSNSYSHCFAYHLQASRGTPLKYYDGENFFSIAFGRDGCDVVAIAPVGEKCPGILANLAVQLKNVGIELRVKKVTSQDVESFQSLGFDHVSFQNDFEFKHRPDDIHPELGIRVLDFNWLDTGENNSLLRRKIKPTLYVPPEVDKTNYRNLLGFGAVINNIVSSGLANDIPPHKALAQFVRTYPFLFKGQLDYFGDNPNFSFATEFQPDKLQFEFNDFKNLNLDVISEINQFLSNWANKKAARTGGDPGDFIDPYRELFKDPKCLSSAHAFIMRDASNKIAAFLVVDRAAPDTLSVIMNLADTDVPNAATALLIRFIDCLHLTLYIAPDQHHKLKYLNLGGSEDENLHQFKSRFKPFQEEQPAYLKFVGNQ